MSNYQTYFIAGPENILPNHLLGSESSEEALIRIVRELANYGLSVFQLRAKTISEDKQIDILRVLKKALKNTHTQICINDSVSIASKAGEFIDILHLGQSDMQPEKAKTSINKNIKIGLSITKESQINSIPDCVDYIGVGPIYKTNSKDDADKPIGEILLQQIIQKVDIPVVAIGGINLDNCLPIINSGVNAIAMINALYSRDKVSDKILEIKRKFLND